MYYEAGSYVWPPHLCCVQNGAFGKVGDMVYQGLLKVNEFHDHSILMYMDQGAARPREVKGIPSKHWICGGNPASINHQIPPPVAVAPLSMMHFGDF